MLYFLKNPSVSIRHCEFPLTTSGQVIHSSCRFLGFAFFLWFFFKWLITFLNLQKCPSTQHFCWAAPSPMSYALLSLGNDMTIKTRSSCLWWTTWTTSLRCSAPAGDRYLQQLFHSGDILPGEQEASLPMKSHFNLQTRTHQCSAAQEQETPLQMQLVLPAKCSFFLVLTTLFLHPWDSY